MDRWYWGIGKKPELSSRVVAESIKVCLGRNVTETTREAVQNQHLAVAPAVYRAVSAPSVRPEAYPHL
jgi:hypothetical protein